MKLFLSILFIVNINFGSFVLSQEDTVISINNDNNYIEIAKSWYRKNNSDSVFHYLELGLDYYKQTSNWENYLLCLNGLSASCDVSGDYAKMFALVNEAKSIVPLLPNKRTEAYSSLLNNMATVLADKNEFDQAILLLEEALSIDKELGKVETQIAILRNIGRCYSNKGDYNEGLIYYNEALKIQTLELKAFNPNLALSYSHIADIYRIQAKHEKAIALLHKSLDMLNSLPNKTDNTNVKQRIGAHLKLGKIYAELKKQDKFKEHLHVAQKLEQKYQDKRSSDPEMFLGDWHLQNGKRNLAYEAFQEALDIRKINLNSFVVHPEIGEVYSKIGQCHLGNMNLNASLSFFQKALSNYSYDFFPDDDLLNPDIDQLSLDNETLNVLHFKAQTLMALYLEDIDGNIDFLNLSKKTYELCINVLERIRRNYMSPKSKEIISTQAEHIYSNAMTCYHKLFLEQPTWQHKNDIFQLMEANKSSILYESINETFAKQYSGIPDSLKVIENDFRKEIAFYQKTIAEKSTRFEPERIEDLRTELFSIRRSYQQLIKRFENEYPNYYKLKYNDSKVTINQVQNSLTDQSTCMVEYFIDQDKMYAILITRDSSRLITTAIDNDISSLALELRKLVTQPPKNKNAKADFLTFTRISQRIYNFLIAPLDLEDQIQQLIIIPDETIAHLPFEILIKQTKDVSNVNYDSSNLDYMLNQYELSYNYSIKLYLQSQKRNFQSTQSILSCAPIFTKAFTDVSELRDCSGESLYSLKCTKEESKSIGKLFDGEVLVDELATKSAFLQKAPEFKMLHLATHACIDEKNPMLSKIFFSNDEYLTNYELFNLKLNAELVVLSACNTGVGNLVKGEGILNLNRGFLQAGCPSSVISLWSIDDCSSKDIMTYYYRNIKNGFSKNKAMREAKLNYLNEASMINRHPFYWSAFIQYGDVNKIEMSRGKNTMLFVGIAMIALIVLFLIVGFIYRRLGVK